MKALGHSAALRLRAALVGGALAALALAGCGASCQDACENVAVVCDADFKASEIAFNVESCVESCDSNLAGCEQIEEETACVAAAASCSELAACTRCQ